MNPTNPCCASPSTYESYESLLRQAVRRLAALFAVFPPELQPGARAGLAARAAQFSEAAAGRVCRDVLGVDGHILAEACAEIRSTERCVQVCGAERCTGRCGAERCGGPAVVGGEIGVEIGVEIGGEIGVEIAALPSESLELAPCADRSDDPSQPQYQLSQPQRQQKRGSKREREPRAMPPS